MKTALLIRNAAAKDFGGAETYPVSLAKIIETHDWHPIIVSSSKKLLDHADSKNVSAIRSPWLKYQGFTGRRLYLFPLYLVWQMYLTMWYIGLITKTNAHVLHIQSRDDFIAASIAGRLLHRRVIWTDHMDLRYILKNVVTPFRNFVGKLVLWASRFADHVILISDNERELVTKNINPKSIFNKKVIVIKNGVIDRKSDFQKEPQEHFTFCLASRIVHNKGIGEAIDAFDLLAKSTKQLDAKLHIYGDGEDLAYFKRKASHNKNIIFFGHKTNILEAVNNADVYILPSYQEGFSIALLEATMLGKAIIASNVDSNPEIIDDSLNGLLVAPKSPQQLSDAMRELYLHKTTRATFEAAIRTKYEARFDLDNIVKKQILPLYK
jgi:glycosyltransferase involved in cell wall biosynthesis